MSKKYNFLFGYLQFALFRSGFSHIEKRRERDLEVKFKGAGSKHNWVQSRLSLQRGRRGAKQTSGSKCMKKELNTEKKKNSLFIPYSTQIHTGVT